MITCAEYMANSKTLYRPYYLELATAAGIDLSADLPLINRCRDALKAGDVHLYAVPLGSWDARALALQGPISRAMKERGDTWSIAGGVCVLKEAARAAAEAAQKRYELKEAVGGGWMVLVDGLQWGQGPRDASGASSQTWPTREEAIAAIERE